MIVEVASVAQAVAALSACWAIISGINAWKREFIGKRRIELAELALAQFYELEEILKYVRNPFSGNNEGKTRKRETGETEDQARLLDQAYVVIERIQAKETQLNAFRALKFRFMATFGRDTSTIFDDTSAVFHSVVIAAHALGTYYWQRQGRVPMTADEQKQHLTDMQRHQASFWDTGQDDDELRKRVNVIQERLEAVVRPSFEEASQLYKLALQPFWKG